MTWDTTEVERELKARVDSFDRVGATEVCERLIGDLNRTDEPFPEKPAKKVLGMLRNKRYFDLMQRVADTFIQTGQASFQIRRQYAQSLIDQNNLTSALRELQPLVADTKTDPVENPEARGLIGRVYKQLYVNAGEQTARRDGHLRQAIQAYYEVFDTDREKHFWHGINVVALVERGRRDGVDLKGAPDSRALAAEILALLQAKESRGEVDAWGCATAVEACVALGQPVDALPWLARYLKSPYADAFELASTLRQLTEVWKLDDNSGSSAAIITMLRSQLLDRQGGRVEISVSDLRAGGGRSLDMKSLEATFGNDGVKTLRWYLNGLKRSQMVGRVEDASGKGFGTGFLLRGTDLHPSFGQSTFLLTNAHVVSDTDSAQRKALRSDEAFVTFEAPGAGMNAGQPYKVRKLVWSSPVERVDASLLELSPAIACEECYPVSKHPPANDGTQRVYIIGHPEGGKLSFSLQDNLLLDFEDPYLHYRAPTEGGSSGSPVFNSQWDLVGLHHAGAANMRRLRGQDGTYAANEGIWFTAIRSAVAKDL